MGWLDDSVAPGRWVSLLTHRDGHAEAIAADHRIGIFRSKAAARDWLKTNGFVRGKLAVKRALVDAVPPNPLPKAKSGAAGARERAVSS